MLSKIALCAALISTSLCAQSRRDNARGVPGRFDYYVLSLSWSPQHCSTPAGDRDRYQCAGSRQFGFVAHGLWPQFERGWPQFCTQDRGPDQATIDQMLPIMPSAGLIRHEWSKHGSCSGLGVSQYFAKVRQAYQSVKIPPEYQAPLKNVMVAPRKLKERFLEVNRVGDASNLAVLCSGRFLQEVRVCLDKNLKPRACGTDVRDSCRVPQMIMQPVR
ncbi:MAG: ribonuclease T2 [Bryobacteraceae bacterium]